MIENLNGLNRRNLDFLVPESSSVANTETILDSVKITKLFNSGWHSAVKAGNVLRVRRRRLTAFVGHLDEVLEHLGGLTVVDCR